MDEKILEAKWKDEVLPLAFSMEEGLLAALSATGKSRPEAGVTISAAAVATAHLMEVIARFSPESDDLREPFVDVFKNAYEFYKEHPTDPDIPMINTMLN